MMLVGLMMMASPVMAEDKDATAEVTPVVKVIEKKSDENAGQNTNHKWHGQVDDFFHYTGFDLDIQAGIGYHFDTRIATNDASNGFVRARIGVLHVPQYPWAIFGGMTLEGNYLSGCVWGLQGELIHQAFGGWIRGGFGSDQYVRPHFNAAIGYSLFGVEVQGYSVGPYASESFNDKREGIAVMGVVRIPIGYIAYVFSKR